jgi:hypothetical protein
VADPNDTAAGDQPPVEPSASAADEQTSIDQLERKKRAQASLIRRQVGIAGMTRTVRKS